MRLSLRFILPLALALAAIAYAVVPLVDRLTLRWSVNDLDMRSNLIASAIHDSIEESLTSGSKARTLRLFNEVIQDERLYALGFCGVSGGPQITTKTFPAEIACNDLGRFKEPSRKLLGSAKGPLHVSVVGIDADGTRIGNLVLVHDMSFVQRRSEETKRYVFYFFVGLGAVVSLITVVIAQLSWRGWMEGVRALLRGEGLLRPAGTDPQATLPELRPLASDLRSLIRDIESEYRARDESQLTWTPETLRTILRNDLRGEDVLVVSNREPYIHVRRGDRIEVSAAGERAGHRAGAGHARLLGDLDRPRQRLGGPGGRGQRTTGSWSRPECRRTPSAGSGCTDEEEAGYYYGFSNEGLWPLCHIAHVRPTFRTADWKQYIAGNRKFARRRGRGGEDGRSHRAGSGLPFRPAAEDDPREAAERHRHHLLAHPLAEPGGVRDLPLARGTARRAPRQQHPGLPHPVPLQQFRRHRGPDVWRRGWTGKPSR